MVIHCVRYVLLLAILVSIQSPPAWAQQDAATIGARLMTDAVIKGSMDAIKAAEPQTIEDQVRICEVEAPPFKENKRAEVLARMFREAGLQNVRTDKVGNVLGDRTGAQPHPHLVFSAHLDTVFPDGTDVKVKREGTILKGPGIGDDCRGLAVLLAVIRAMDQAKIQTPGSITFLADVGEKGLGICAARHVQGAWRAQLRRVRLVEPDARARPRCGHHLAIRSARRSKDDVQRRDE